MPPRAPTRLLRPTEVGSPPSAALAVAAGPELMGFLRLQQGYRPGGLAVFNEIFRPYLNDEMYSVELGLRYGRSAKAPFYADISVAYTKWTDIQAEIINLGSTITTNIGDGRIYTLDVSAGWRPVPGLRLDVAAVFNDTKIIKPPTTFPSGTKPEDFLRLPNVAAANVRAGIEYGVALSDRLDLRLNAAARYSGKSRAGVGELFDQFQGDWLDTSLGARLATGRHAFSLTVTNLLDSVGNRFALGSPLLIGTKPQITPLRPRTLRIGWETRF